VGFKDHTQKNPLDGGSIPPELIRGISPFGSHEPTGPRRTSSAGTSTLNEIEVFNSSRAHMKKRLYD